MIHRPGYARRRRWIAAAAVLAMTVFGLVASQAALRPHPLSARPPGQRVTPRPRVSFAVGGASTYIPPRVTTPSSQAQSQVDKALAQAETQDLPDRAVVSFLPEGGDSTGYPAVPTADRNDPGAYAMAFVTELLDRHYAQQSPTQLLAWAQAESSPNTLPGVPAGLASRSLVLSLVAIEGSDGPVPSRDQWTVAAAEGTAQTVSDLQTEVDPDWLSLISTGWEAVDPAMTMLSVTGALSTRIGHASRSQSVALVITLGSNAARPGYGAVAVDGWTVR